MGLNGSKYKKIFSNDNLEINELEQKILSCIDTNNTRTLFNCLDDLHKHNLTIDKYYRNYTLPYYVITSNLSSKEKYTLLSKLLKHYNFDLNKKIGNYGNIIVCSVDTEKYIPLYELLLEHGAEINCVDCSFTGTAIDILANSRLNDDIELRKFLISRGAKSISDGIVIVK